MSRVACPHCGFQNFSISAYCGRCERPLAKVEDTVVTRAPTAAELAARAASRPAPQAAPARPETPKAAPRPNPTPPPRRVTPPPPPDDEAPTAISPPPRPPASMGAVPPPLPPLAMEAAPLPKRPIELDDRARRAVKRAQGPNLSDEPATSDGEIPVTVPSTPRQLLARLVDALLVAAVFAFVVLIEELIRGNAFAMRHTSWLDQAAEWINVHGSGALHGTILATIAGCAYSVRAALSTGQTVGRRLTDTVLVRRSGRPMTWPVLTLRTLASLASAACFGAGFLWTLIDVYHRTWHDIVAGTVVVRRHVRL